MTPSEKLLCKIFGTNPSALRDFPILIQDHKNGVEAALNTLKPREKEILLYRFGFYNGGCKTLRDIGHTMGVTGVRIREIESRSLRKLRHPSTSKKLNELFYRPTDEELESLHWRKILYNELREFFPESPAIEIVKGIKRPYLKRALRDLTRGNVAEQLRQSCDLPMRFCRKCGTITLPNWDFCCKECEKGYKTITLICAWCGNTFERSQSLVIYRLNKGGFKKYYCGNHCCGTALGKRIRKK